MEQAQIEYPYSVGDATSANEILDRMEEVVRADQIVHGRYVAREVDYEVRASGAICGGHKFCAIGTLMFAAGEPIIANRGYSQFVLFGTEYDHRHEAEERHPFLADARKALNQAARVRMDSDEFAYIGGMENNPDELEVFFECYARVKDSEGRSYFDGEITYKDLLDVIADARELLPPPVGSLSPEWE